MNLVVKGVDRSGKEILLIDTDHDSNFDDESPVIVHDYLSDQDLRDLTTKSIQVKYSSVFKNKVVSRTIPLLILKSQDRYLYSFPQYAVAEIKLNNGTYPIAVSHEFRFPNYDIANVVCLSNPHISRDSIARKNQYLHIGGRMFKNRGVDFSTLTLTLEEVATSKPDGAQKGMQAISFNGKNVMTGNEIRLNDMKGKFVFIDFWGTWCSPCVAQLPALIDIYSKLDKAKVAFLGIAGKDNMDKLRKMINEKGILWANILSDSTNQIVEKYNILEYPTGILIDPDGKIIETSVSSMNLEMLLKKYLGN